MAQTFTKTFTYTRTEVLAFQIDLVVSSITGSESFSIVANKGIKDNRWIEVVNIHATDSDGGCSKDTGVSYGPQRAFVVEFRSQHPSKEGKTMFGPGAYRPDVTEGIPVPADLPQPEMVPSSRNDKRHACPYCGHQAYRDKQFQRTLHDVGNLDVWCPRDLVVTYSQHSCTTCRTYLNADLSDLAPPGSHSTHRVIDLAVRLVVEDGVPSRPASWHLWRDHRVFVPFATMQHWSEAGGKKGSDAHGHGRPGLGLGGFFGIWGRR